MAYLDRRNEPVRTPSGYLGRIDRNPPIEMVLAPLFAWIVGNWMPLLQERRLPSGGRLGDGRLRSARATYLAVVEGADDDIARFRSWQCWANRHSLRFAADGGILPDMFIQPMEDDLESSIADWVQPGSAASLVLCMELS